MAATHVDLFNCSRLAEWLEEHDRMANAAQFAKSLRAVMAGFVAATDPTPPPATKAMLERTKTILRVFGDFRGNSETIARIDEMRAFLAEWAEPATPPAPEQPEEASPWKCSVCGEPVQISDELIAFHASETMHNHDAELSNEDKRTLADGPTLED